MIKSFILGEKNGFSTQNNLFFYLFVTVLVEGYSFVVDKIDESILIGLQYNLYLMFVTVFFYFFYSKSFYSKIPKALSKISLLICQLFIIFFTKFLGLDFDEKIAIAAMLFLIVHSIIWYCNKLFSVDDDKIFNDPNFWISSGLLLWSCFGIFRCLPMYYFYNHDKEFSNFIKSNFDVVNIILYLLIFISLFKYEYNFKRRTSSNH
ncbi:MULTISPECIES: hypothetical protein [Chryseobacterium]|uniref:Uncharacterized protein n=1 Tax=Chryseobacterium gambrini TaxID=373672 RepID=A0ABM8KAG2_9FLAO|nr:hypothetical protein CRDW_30150 [Chryseobacterium gambrini]